MSFNIDDPLAGILSDGSDDSFFDDDVLGKKKPVKKKNPSIKEKSAVFNLGDFNENKETFTDLGDTNVKNSDLNILAKERDKLGTPSPASFRRTISKESIKTQPMESKSKPVSNVFKSPSKPSSGKNDILSELIPDSKKETVKSLERGKSSQSLLDDILGAPSIKAKGISQTGKTASVKDEDFNLDSFIGKTDSKQTMIPKNVPQKEIIKTESIKSLNKKKSADDWLGIFEDKKDDAYEEDDTGMPAWLGGNVTKKKKAVDTNKNEESKQSAVKDQDKDQQSNDTIQLQIKKGEENKVIEQNMEQVMTTGPSSNILKTNELLLSNEDITAEGTALYLQQQESQLKVALQLQAQEARLASLQMRQRESQRVHREAALAQHAQLDGILQRQAEQRLQMQAVITAHQDRITQRIKALLDTSTRDNNENIDTNVEDGYENTSSEKKETPHMKEKKQLLQLVQSLQENHDKEIDLMENSYRRQLAFLEVSVNQAEERMKEESDKLVKFYTEKIHWLEEHHQLFKKLTEDNLTSLIERHKTENELLRQQHLENVKVLQEHHVALMENIKNAVKQEQILIQDAAGFSSELHELIADVRENKSYSRQLVETIQSLSEKIKGDADKNLHVRETLINDMIQQLKKERDNFEVEKTETREVVRMLETRLKQMTTMVEEDSTVLKQKKMEFEFERATFNKQTEFAKNILKKQDEEVKMLKDDMQKEYREKIMKLEEEKANTLKDTAHIAKEKASVQNLKQELEKMKAELQAQLEEVTEEKSKLNVDKQQLHMEEQRISAKNRDLDLFAKTAIEKEAQADKKYSEAEIMQRKYEERIRRMQEHVVSLNLREKQIAKEKVALSRERLSIHNEKKQIESRQQCSLCKSSQNVPQYSYESTYNCPETFFNPTISRNYGSSVTAMNAIEREMANLMGRNFVLRHSVDVGQQNSYNETPIGDRDGGEDVYQSAANSTVLKDYLDPKFMMLRLDVQQVISNLDQSKKQDDQLEKENGRRDL